MFITAVNLQGRPEFPELLPQYSKALHIEGRSTEHTVQGLLDQEVVHIPSRDKKVIVRGDLQPKFLSRLEVLDSTAPGKTQAEKFSLAQEGLNTPHRIFLEIQGQHCGGAFLVKQQPVWSYVVFSGVSTYYALGSYDFAASLRTYDPSLWLFRLPTVNTGCLFWSTEALCSKWWRWSKTFNKDRLKCCNALELHLYDRRLVL